MHNVSFQKDILPLKNELYRLALRITLNAADAEDVVQETMLRVWNRRHQWNEIESIEAFCLTICRNQALDKTRRMGRRDESLNEDIHQRPDHSYTSNPEEQVIQQDRLQLLNRLINQLPEKQRTVMQLREKEGKTYKEIADVMGITEDQVKINLFRARQTIKQQFLDTEY